MSELLPCPFCGGPATPSGENDTGSYARCLSDKGCILYAKWNDLDKWQRRPSPSTEAGMTEEVKADLWWIESNSHDPHAMASAPELAGLAAYVRRLSAGKEGI